MEFRTPVPAPWAEAFAGLDPGDLYGIQSLLGAMSMVGGICGPMFPADIRMAAPALIAELEAAEQRARAH